MDESTAIVQRHYDENPALEYARIDGRPEFLITSRFMKRHIRPGERVLDVGGGPGRYAHMLAEMGCCVTLIDLSGENARFAKARADEMGLPLTAMAGDAREADTLVEGTFDHVLLMGPMYHLLEEADRVRAVEACLNKLKPGGTLWVSFIVMFAGMIYGMKFCPEIIVSDEPMEKAFREHTLAGESYAGDAFTRAFFIEQREVEPFMARFPLEKVHLFGQESILSPCEGNITSQPKAVYDAWLDLAEALAERENLLGWSEHLMYVGRKNG